MVHLSLVEGPTADPQYYALLQTVLMFREHHHHDEVFRYCMSELHHTRRTYVPRLGPISVLLNRLRQIAWSWQDGTVFLDHQLLPIDVRQCPVQELKERLIEGWQARVKGIALQRKTFRGLQWTSVPLTLAGTKHLTADDAALQRVCLNGTFFTADRKKTPAIKQRHHVSTLWPARFSGPPPLVVPRFFSLSHSIGWSSQCNSGDDALHCCTWVDARTT